MKPIQQAAEGAEFLSETDHSRQKSRQGNTNWKNLEKLPRNNTGPEKLKLALRGTIFDC